MTDTYAPPFTARDHTKLVQAVQDHPLHVIKYLDVVPGHRPTTLQILDAAMKVKAFDASTKARIAAARAAYVQSQTTSGNAAAAELNAKVREALDGKTVPEMIAGLDDLLENNTHDASTAGLQLARDILVDGADSIYSEDSPWSELSQIDTDAPHQTGAQHMAQVDADAAAIVGGTDIGAAVAGAESAADAVFTVLDAFFGHHD